MRYFLDITLIKKYLLFRRKTMCHRDYMKLAIEQANIAKESGEVPVGCVIVHNNEVIAVGYNQRENEKNAISHAEVIAIDLACKKLDKWRLSDCVIYVTLEPCIMCMGAILNARIGTLVFGVNEEKTGGCGGLVNLNEVKYPHKLEVIQGICEFECQELVTDFFKKIREKIR